MSRRYFDGDEKRRVERFPVSVIGIVARMYRDLPVRDRMIMALYLSGEFTMKEISEVLNSEPLMPSALWSLYRRIMTRACMISKKLSPDRKRS